MKQEKAPAVISNKSPRDEVHRDLGRTVEFVRQSFRPSSRRSSSASIGLSRSCSATLAAATDCDAALPAGEKCPPSYVKLAERRCQPRSRRTVEQRAYEAARRAEERAAPLREQNVQCLPQRAVLHQPLRAVAVEPQRGGQDVEDGLAAHDLCEECPPS